MSQVAVLLSVRVGLNPGVFESKYAARYTGHDISFKKKKNKRVEIVLWAHLTQLSIFIKNLVYDISNDDIASCMDSFLLNKEKN